MSLVPPSLRRGYESVLSAPVQRLVAWNVSPNVITSVGTLVLLGAGVAFGLGRIRTGAALLLLSGMLDTLDGRVARASGGTTKFGAFYDSTMDRLGESALFAGIGLYFLRGGVAEAWQLPGAGIALVALAGSLMVSYARARAEGLGLECKVGIAQRAERILGLGVPTLFFGAGPDGLLLLGIATVLAFVSVITVIQRVIHVYRITRDPSKPRSTQARKMTTRELAHYMGKGRSGE